MASITIRRLDDAVKAKLRLRAASNGHSMEEEARAILKAGLGTNPSCELKMAESIRRRMAPLGGVNLKIPKRGPTRPPPDFS